MWVKALFERRKPFSTKQSNSFAELSQLSSPSLATLPYDTILICRMIHPHRALDDKTDP